MTRKQSAYFFFLKHSGYSVGPDETRQQGRARCAKQLAEAERRADDGGMTFAWEPDDVPFECACDDPTCESHEPHQAYGCVARDACGTVVGSLWGISFGPGVEPDGQTYARVVQAELALEHFHSIDRLTAEVGPDPFALNQGESL